MWISHKPTAFGCHDQNKAHVPESISETRRFERPARVSDGNKVNVLYQSIHWDRSSFSLKKKLKMMFFSRVALGFYFFTKSQLFWFYWLSNWCTFGFEDQNNVRYLKHGALNDHCRKQSLRPRSVNTYMDRTHYFYFRNLILINYIRLCNVGCLENVVSVDRSMAYYDLGQGHLPPPNHPSVERWTHMTENITFPQPWWSWVVLPGWSLLAGGGREGASSYPMMPCEKNPQPLGQNDIHDCKTIPYCSLRMWG